VWSALADPTRRRILDELRRRPLPTGRLASRFPQMTRFGVRKHLRLLEEAGLVLVERRGRERWNHVNPVPIRAIHDRWLRSFETLDADRLLAIRRLAESAEASPTPPSVPGDDMKQDESPVGTRNILVEVLIEAPLERVWKTMVLETSAWWHKDFYTTPDPAGFHIEPRLGGRMYEDWGDGAGQVWGHVNGLREPSYLQVVGDSSKEWGGPSRNIMTWRLEQEGATTRLRLEHSIFGRITPEVEDSLVSGWNQLFRDCLKPFAETGVVPAEAGAKSAPCRQE